MDWSNIGLKNVFDSWKGGSMNRYNIRLDNVFDRWKRVPLYLENTVGYDIEHKETDHYLIIKVEKGFHDKFEPTSSENLASKQDLIEFWEKRKFWYESWSDGRSLWKGQKGQSGLWVILQETLQEVQETVQETEEVL